MYRCIFRFHTNNFICCKNITDSSFCFIHRHTKNKIFSYIHHIIKDPDKTILSYEIIQIYSYLYQHIHDFQLRKSLISPLFGNKKHLFSISNDFGIYTNSKSLKKNVIRLLIDKLEWICLISKLKSFHRKISLIQHSWFAYTLFISGSNLKPSLNNEDPFSFDDVDSLQYPFYIKDHDAIYCFDAANIYFFILKSGLWNPYTRNLLSTKDLYRLEHYIKIKNIHIQDKPNWNTISQAYTDVALKFESHGFLTNIEWYVSLSFNDILRILNKYHQLSILMPHDFLCDEYIHSTYPQYVFQFCNMLLELLNYNDEPDIFTYVCILYKSFSFVSRHFRDNQPLWIRDIQPSFFIQIDFIS